MQICSEPLPVATALAPGLPDAVDDFFEKALCRDPRRPLSIGARARGRVFTRVWHRPRSPLVHLDGSELSRPRSRSHRSGDLRRHRGLTERDHGHAGFSSDVSLCADHGRRHRGAAGAADARSGRRHARETITAGTSATRHAHAAAEDALVDRDRWRIDGAGRGGGDRRHRLVRRLRALAGALGCRQDVGYRCAVSRGSAASGTDHQRHSGHERGAQDRAAQEPCCPSGHLRPKSGPNVAYRASAIERRVRRNRRALPRQGPVAPEAGAARWRRRPIRLPLRRQ